MSFAEGSYGCVYKPGFKCNKAESNNVSKVVNNKYAQQEIVMSNLIRDIPKYKDYFVPVESWCEIDSSRVESCNALRSASTFMVLNIPFKKTVDIDFTLVSFRSLLPHLTKLCQADIVHFDLTLHNILFTPAPLIIDFGISMHMTNLNVKNSFYMYNPQQYEWPIDVHLLCHLVRKPILTKEALTTVVQEVYRQSPVLNMRSVPACVKHYSYILNGVDPIQRLLLGWKTWDLYALAVMLHVNTGLTLSPCVRHDPSKRPSVLDVEKLINKIEINKKMSGVVKKPWVKI